MQISHDVNMLGTIVIQQHTFIKEVSVTEIFVNLAGICILVWPTKTFIQLS